MNLPFPSSNPTRWSTSSGFKPRKSQTNFMKSFVFLQYTTFALFSFPHLSKNTSDLTLKKSSSSDFLSLSKVWIFGVTISFPYFFFKSDIIERTCLSLELVFLIMSTTSCSERGCNEGGLHVFPCCIKSPFILKTLAHTLQLKTCSDALCFRILCWRRPEQENDIIQFLNFSYKLIT